MKKITKIVLALPLMTMVGCCASPTAADKATYQAVAPEYVEYVNADTKLSPTDKQSRLDTIETWRLRVGVAK